MKQHDDKGNAKNKANGNGIPPLSEKLLPPICKKPVKFLSFCNFFSIFISISVQDLGARPRARAQEWTPRWMHVIRQ